MAIAHRTHGALTILDIVGRFREGEGVEEFRDAIDSLIRDQANQVVLNLVELYYCDDAGVRALIRAHQLVKVSGGSLRLVLSRRIGQFNLPDSAKLYLVFDSDIFDDESKAISSFGSGARG